MDFRDGDLAVRVNFATQEDGEIVDRRVGRDLPSEDSHALAAGGEREGLPAGAPRSSCAPPWSTAARW